MAFSYANLRIDALCWEVRNKGHGS